MPNVVTQRIGPYSRIIATAESTPGTDPGGTAGFVLPLRAQSGFKITQPTTEAPIFNQSLQPYGRVYGIINAAGQLPLGLEFLTCPFFLKQALGSAGYTKTNLVTGAFHDFYIPSGLTTVGSHQLQAESGETTAQFLRAKYVRVQSISTQYAASGVTPFDVTCVGSGDSSTTDLANTKTFNGYSAVSQFNGQASINGLTITGMPSFNWTLNTGASRQDVAFNQGVAASVNPGVIKAGGTVALAMATDGSNPENNYTFYNYAVNQQLVPLDCAWFNGPLSTATMFMDITMPTCFFDRASWTPGGAAGIITTQPYNIVQDTTSVVAGWTMNTVQGPWTFTGSNNVFTFKADGGSNIAVTTTTGSRTAAQVVADLNANGGFSAALVADVFGAYVRVKSKQVSLKGASSSVQFVTGQTNGAEALMGWNNAAVAGYNTALFIRVYNSSQVAF